MTPGRNSKQLPAGRRDDDRDAPEGVRMILLVR